MTQFKFRVPATALVTVCAASEQEARALLERAETVWLERLLPGDEDDSNVVLDVLGCDVESAEVINFMFNDN